VRLAGTWATCSGVPWATQEVHLDPCLPVASARLETARITAHVLLSWLALLLVRVIEVRCSRSWCRIRQEMDRLHRGVFEGPAGRFVQRTELSPLREKESRWICRFDKIAGKNYLRLTSIAECIVALGAEVDHSACGLDHVEAVLDHDSMYGSCREDAGVKRKRQRNASR